MVYNCTSDPSKAVSQSATVQITVDHGPKIGTVKTISPLKALLIYLFKVLEMILNTLVIGRILGPARTVGAVSPFTPVLDSPLYRDRDRLGLVVHHLFESAAMNIFCIFVQAPTLLSLLPPKASG